MKNTKVKKKFVDDDFFKNLFPVQGEVVKKKSYITSFKVHLPKK